MTDNELMMQVRDGDLQKLGLLFERHHARLFLFAFRMTGDREVSKDVVQDVFHRILKYRHTFRGEGSFATWMYHLARNVIRRSLSQVKTTYPLETMSSRISGEALPAEQLERKQAKEHLKAALGQLPFSQREVLVLSRYEDMKYKDIAEMLGCSEGAVKVRIHRALKELRTYYLERSNEEGYDV